MRKSITLEEYNPRWATEFQVEKDRILDVIGDRLLAVEHIGSTAVPGLGGKPTIDILAGVAWLEDADLCIEPLATMGYHYIPEYEAYVPERRYFRKGPLEMGTHHLHMVELTSSFWNTHLLFRDFLRKHPEIARRYFEYKKELANQYNAGNLQDYTGAKTPFVEAVLEQAGLQRRTYR